MFEEPIDDGFGLGRGEAFGEFVAVPDGLVGDGAVVEEGAGFADEADGDVVGERGVRWRFLEGGGSGRDRG